MKYIVMSTAVQDVIRFADARPEICAAGGAGIYALAGMRLWTDDVGIVTGVGADYSRLFGEWYRRNRLSMQGLTVKTEYTPRNIIQYRSDGERTETPVFGESHYQGIEPQPADLLPFLHDTAGVYVFKNADPVFWRELLALKRTHGFRLLWEIGADAALPSMLNTVLDIARQSDMFSINCTEACSLFGVHGINAAIHMFFENRLPCVYLRNGADGVYLLKDDTVWHVPSVSDAVVVDPTGGGNSSTGAALIGLCRDRSPAEIAAMGNVSASVCIRQYGVPPAYDALLRQTAQVLMCQTAARARMLPADCFEA